MTDNKSTNTKVLDKNWKNTKLAIYKIFCSTRFKLISSFLIGSLFVGIISMMVGGQLLYDTVIHEATNRIRLNLNTAREIYQNNIKQLEVAMNITAMKSDLNTSIKSNNIPQILSRLNLVAEYLQLDFGGVVSPQGDTLCRLGPDSTAKNKAKTPNPLTNFVIQKKASVSGTIILDKDFLLSENPELAQKVKITLIATPLSVTNPKAEENSGMAIAAAVPIFENNKLLAVIYGGVLLNKSVSIVDKIRENLFQDENYKGKRIGTATIFFKDIRIATNVIGNDGQRAVGTLASKKVEDHVLLNGKQWTDRAFVVSDWYLTAYEPIEDIFKQRVGMLYVGVLEDKYVDIQREAFLVFIIITLISMAFAGGLGYILAQKLMNPIQQLIQASKEVAQGNFSPDIGPISEEDEIGVLQKMFKKMLSSFKEHNRRLKAESDIKLLQSEKQASIGRLAAGVAHEINNPLTGVLTFTHLLLRRNDINEEIRSDLQTIARETDRVRKIVKGLLDFSRQIKIETEPTNINNLIQNTINLIENQALIKGINLMFKPDKFIPELIVDRNQIQSAILNMLINAIDATGPGGSITVLTGITLSTNKDEGKGLEITIIDTGCGIDPENFDKLLDPFFTTKKVGEGTGLGLSVSLGIVERHEGTIRIQSEVGKGSAFTILLPIKDNNEK